MNQTMFHGNIEPHRNCSYCCFHREEVFVGVCPLCLNERLLTLASLKQSHYNKHRAQHHHCSRGPSFSLSAKILGLGSLLNRLELQRRKLSSEFSCDGGDHTSGSTSREDSFISIKFEDNGVAFWDKDNKSNNNESITEINTDSSERHDKQIDMRLNSHANESYKPNNTSVPGHIRSRGAGAFGFTKWIGNIFEHFRWRSAGITNMGK